MKWINKWDENESGDGQWSIEIFTRKMCDIIIHSSLGHKQMCNKINKWNDQNRKFKCKSNDLCGQIV